MRLGLVWFGLVWCLACWGAQHGAPRGGLRWDRPFGWAGARREATNRVAHLLGCLGVAAWDPRLACLPSSFFGRGAHGCFGATTASGPPQGSGTRPATARRTSRVWYCRREHADKGNLRSRFSPPLKRQLSSNGGLQPVRSPCSRVRSMNARMEAILTEKSDRKDACVIGEKIKAATMGAKRGPPSPLFFDTRTTPGVLRPSYCRSMHPVQHSRLPQVACPYHGKAEKFVAQRPNPRPIRS